MYPSRYNYQEPNFKSFYVWFFVYFFPYFFLFVKRKDACKANRDINLILVKVI